MQHKERELMRGKASCFAAVAAGLALVAASGAALSAPSENASERAHAMSKEKIERIKQRAKTGPMAKMSPHLSELVVKAEAAATPIDKTASGVDSPLEDASVQTIDGLIVVDISTHGDAAELLVELEALGLQRGTAFGHVVSGLLPVEALPGVAASGAVVSIQPSVAMTNVGLVTSRGDVSMGTDVARGELPVDGTGVRVGVLSDSFDCTNPGEAAVDIATGDLPEDIIVLADIASGCIDEGRAMMQIVHDIAPGASQAFHTAFTGQAGFAQGIIDLNEVAGSSVVVDDVIYFAEPMFQDGVIAQAADQVRANGATYFSSAGNNERNSYESEFRPSGEFGVFGCERHDFDPGPGVDTLQTFVILPGSTRWSFQWDQPAASVSGAPGSASDLDIVLYDLSGNFLGFGGFGFNIGGDPIEFFGVGLGGNQPFVGQIGLENCGGPNPGLMKYVYFGSDRRFGGGPAEYDTASPTSYGHANAAGAVGTGASAWFNTVAFNDNPACDPACLNGFSSAGGIPILFDTDGNPVFDLRPKPELVGPDGANNTFFGFDLSFPVPGTNEPDGFPNFFGTSASAPHIAGLAALMSQPTLDGQHYYVCNPLVPKNKTQRVGRKAAARLVEKGAIYGVCAGDIVNALIATAIDMDDPFTPDFDEGFDDATGNGFVNGRAAVRSVFIKEVNAGIGN